MRKLIISAIVGAASVSSANAAIITFEDLSAGTILTNLDQADGGQTGDVSADGGSDDAMIFDADNPTGGDSDLGIDGFGKVLIISEEGDTSDPDDNARGGTLTLNFDTPVTINDFSILDIDRRETASFEFSFAGGGSTSFSVSGADIGDGEARQLSDLVAMSVIDGLTNVASLKLTLSGSGAFDNFDVTPVPLPAGLPLLLTGLAGLNFARRRAVRER
ncbi:MAG: VPLPA-CTERM sorting domain-containing protein [Pseudomonadota bacterium]